MTRRIRRQLGIEIAPLYYAASRPVVERNSAFIVVDDGSRMRF